MTFDQKRKSKTQEPDTINQTEKKAKVSHIVCPTFVKENKVCKTRKSFFGGVMALKQMNSLAILK
jgi:hypothetical protein